METQFGKYNKINCKTNLRVTQYIGYQTNLCEEICKYFEGRRLK